MERLLWICLAGAIGTGARYLIALWAAQRFGSAFPHGTLIVNPIGCFAIAALIWSPAFSEAGWQVYPQGRTRSLGSQKVPGRWRTDRCALRS